MGKVSLQRLRNLDEKFLQAFFFFSLCLFSVLIIVLLCFCCRVNASLSYHQPYDARESSEKIFAFFAKKRGVEVKFLVSLSDEASDQKMLLR